MSIIIGVGPTASGKTSMAKTLTRCWPDMAHMEVGEMQSKADGKKFINEMRQTDHHVYVVCTAATFEQVLTTARQHRAAAQVHVVVFETHRHPAQPILVDDIDGVHVVGLLRAEESDADNQTWTVQGQDDKTVSSSSRGDLAALLGLPN